MSEDISIFLFTGVELRTGKTKGRMRRREEETGKSDKLRRRNALSCVWVHMTERPRGRIVSSVSSQNDR